MRYPPTVALCQIAPQQPANHGKRGSANHEADACSKHPNKVWNKEDDNSGVHQYRQHHT
jgi:hypothetical protein